MANGLGIHMNGVCGIMQIVLLLVLPLVLRMVTQNTVVFSRVVVVIKACKQLYVK